MLSLLLSVWALHTYCGPSSVQQSSVLSWSRGRRHCSPDILLNAGGTASGKTRVCGLLSQHLDEGGCALLQQQSFYRSLSAEELANVACTQPKLAPVMLCCSCMQQLASSASAGL